jgi:hypothetical protein
MQPLIPDRGITWISRNPGVTGVDDMGIMTARTLAKASIVAAGVCFTAVPVIAVAQDWANRRQDTLSLNHPSGMTLIGFSDGSVLGGIDGTPTASEPAFGIPGFGPWWEFSCSEEPHWPHERLQLVDDPTNPTGSGKAIRLAINERGCGAIARAYPLYGAPYSELYVRFRLFPETKRPRNIKLFYTANVGTGHNRHYFSLMRSGALRLASSTTSPPEHTIRTVRDVFAVGRWSTVEMRLVAESAPAAGDGEVHIFVNGEHRLSDTSIQWTRPGEDHLWNRLQWYGHHSNRGWALSYRIGEFYMAGK